MTTPTIMQDRLSDGEIACIDAIKAVIEVMIARGLITPEEMAEPYRRGRKMYIFRSRCQRQRVP